ncbi:TIGR04282 family arsenosugar biosynthesis glycosyltransferase [Microbulbifer sp. MLAF003]|uniref:TIGR04282 family arsenosugar biosynthesis glycosyltransferase n=1 Tax=Microbulbifer sp. MLAF003 TaxID=3032582 RepID=UPI0024ACFA0F|nr:TIGR04282 family arsenosugar biosynthesis glycosyltransferase [Microbulbifer sp. MLAF003]WHI52317.1 TIGR04282 family arsenosugar biosynthesis glycosyltransferase [Microbulbifer sp. MLAF003]
MSNRLSRKFLRLVVMAKAPLAGYAKTRLIPALGEQGAASLAEKLLCHTLEECVRAELGPVELHVTPDPSHAFWRGFPLPAGVTVYGQSQGSLGQRLWHATGNARALGQGLLLLGTDCPSLTAQRLRAAAEELQVSDAVMYPAKDGGYALLGLKEIQVRLFEDIHWSTEVVARQTLDRLWECGMNCQRLEALADIDEPGDLSFLPEGWRDLIRLG